MGIRERLPGWARSLRERLRADERPQERGGSRGWEPRPRLSGDAPDGGRDPATGSPVTDVPTPPSTLPALSPPPERLMTLTAGEIWDLTPGLRSALEGAAPSSCPHVLLAFTLSHCRPSDQLLSHLEAPTPGHLALNVRAGDRLQKSYFRDVQIGDLHLTLSGFPAVLRFTRAEGGMVLDVATSGTLGREEERAALMRGEALPAPGGEHFFVSACKGSFCTRLDRASGWRGGLALRWEGDG